MSASDLNVTPVLGISGDASYNRTKITDYVGNKIYENGSLKRILVDGGYIENNAYHYYLADHLGNNRVVAKADASIVQSTHYYPFGMAFADGVGQAAQPYKFSGKELDSELGLNIYDSQARQLTSGLPRFTSVDPLAEKYYSWSPYAYCANNPIKFVDRDGKQIGWPQVNTQEAKAKQAIQAQLPAIAEAGTETGMSYTDINDATVLVTTVTRGGDAINIDGSAASGVDIGFAAAGLVLPVVSGSLVKGALKAGAEALGIGANAMKRGVANEAKVLKEMGIPKNTKSFTVADPKTGKPVTVIPDGVTEKAVVEVKDTKAVSNTRQIRGERAAAAQQGKEFKIVTGENTKVSRNIPPNEIETRKYLGPQK